MIPVQRRGGSGGDRECGLFPRIGRERIHRRQ
jgi:hypothetical protein